MTENEQIVSELQKVNQSLDKLNSKSGLFTTSTKSFMSGLFHSFGNLVGTIVIFFALLFIASRFNLNKLMTDYFQKMMTGINWSKIIPAPKIEIDPQSL